MGHVNLIIKKKKSDLLTFQKSTTLFITESFGNPHGNQIISGASKKFSQKYEAWDLKRSVAPH